MTDRSSGLIVFSNPPALAPPSGYSQVAEIRGGRLVFIAGQVAQDRQGNIVGVGDMAAQAEQALDNLAAALAAVGGGPRDVVKLTVFTRDMGGIADWRSARERFFAGGPPPAITLVEVAKLFREELLLEVEAVAAIAPAD